jgi:hypothetical protein
MIVYHCLILRITFLVSNCSSDIPGLSKPASNASEGAYKTSNLHWRLHTADCVTLPVVRQDCERPAFKSRKVSSWLNGFETNLI